MRNKKYTTEEFIEKARQVHGDRYDYSLVEYKNSITPVVLICKLHGEFKTTLRQHLHRKNGCPSCSGNKKYTTGEFIEKARQVHGDKYDYSLVEYNGNKLKVKIICPLHGVFEQRADAHLRGLGCIICSGKYAYTTEEFIEKVRQVHGDKYNYSLVEYKNNSSKIKIICPKHGIFEQRAIDHKRGNGCQLCKSSIGENKIREYLEKNGINFVEQKRFDGCRNIKPLPFDFFLYDKNILIEFDGSLHYISKDFFGGETSLTKTKINDNIKNIFAEENNILLLRIPYWELKNIKEILEGVL